MIGHQTRDIEFGVFLIGFWSYFDQVFPHYAPFSLALSGMLIYSMCHCVFQVFDLHLDFYRVLWLKDCLVSMKNIWAIKGVENFKDRTFEVGLNTLHCDMVTL